MTLGRVVKTLNPITAATAAVGRRIVEQRRDRRMNTVLHKPPYAASPQAHDLHRTLTIADLHADPLMSGRDLLRRARVGHVDVPRLIEGGVAVQALGVCVRAPGKSGPQGYEDTSDAVLFLALALGWPRKTWRSGLARALHLAGEARRFAQGSGGRLTFIESATDLVDYLRRRRANPAMTSALLTIEGPAALDGDVNNLGRLVDAGYRIMSVAHVADNQFGGSSSGVRKAGLTKAGRDFVGRLEERSVLIDVAHASVATIDDALGIARRPLVATHTGVMGTHASSRNLSDAHLRGIAQTGGVIGIGFWAAVTGGEEPAAIARAIRHATNVAGIEHVGLGSDFDGTVRTPFDVTGLVQLTDALLVEGFRNNEIARIMGGNVLRLLAATLPAGPAGGGH